jgi:YjbE family integral membrane protein
VLTIVAVKLLEFPYLKLVGAAALLWIAVQLLVPDEGDGDEVKSSSNLMGAIRTILVADLVMSTDNVIAVAGVAKGSVVLLVLGLVISIPLVVFGATILMKLMERFPIIITLGAAVLGWTAGDMAVTDPAVIEWFKLNADWMIDFELFTIWGFKFALSGAGLIGAVLVVAVGKWLSRKKLAMAESEVVR